MIRFLAGLFVGLSLATASAQKFVKVPTNGILKGYIVVDQNSKEVCRDPGVWNEFRGPESYIVCE